MQRRLLLCRGKRPSRAGAALLPEHESQLLRRSQLSLVGAKGGAGLVQVERTQQVAPEEAVIATDGFGGAPVSDLLSLHMPPSGLDRTDGGTDRAIISRSHPLARDPFRKSQRKSTSTRKEPSSRHFLVTISALCAHFADMQHRASSSSGCMRILVTGASGFVGSQLIPRLLGDGHRVRALARDPSRVDVNGIMSHFMDLDARAGVEARPKHDPPEVFTGDVLTGEGLARALRKVEVAYYLIHSMERAPAHGRESPFPERERIAAENFAAAASRAGVRRLVYLGGPTVSWMSAEDAGDDRALSPHLRSREAVERILRDAIPDTVVLRASIVIGARSRSFRFLVRLVERMPVLALPAWHTHRTRPIDARDVIDMLAGAATVGAAAGRTLDVGGPDILSYGEMIRRIAELMLLARPAVGLGVNVTPLTARLAAAIADEDPELVGALMESLQGDLLPGGPAGSSHLRAAEMLGIDLHSFDSAVECSLREWESVERLAAR